MPGATANGIPYPLEMEPLADVALRIRNLADWFGNLPRAKVRRSTAVSIPNGTGWTDVNLPTLVYSEGSPKFGRVAASGQLTVPAGHTGLYTVTWGQEWAVSSAGMRAMRITLNGAHNDDMCFRLRGTTDSTTFIKGAVDIALTAADVLAAQVMQTSGAALDMNGAYLSVRRVA